MSREVDRAIRQVRIYWDPKRDHRELPKDALAAEVISNTESLGKHPLVEKVVAGFDNRSKMLHAVVVALPSPLSEGEFMTSSEVHSLLGNIVDQVLSNPIPLRVSLVRAEVSNGLTNQRLLREANYRPIQYLGTIVNLQAA